MQRLKSRLAQPREGPSTAMAQDWAEVGSSRVMSYSAVDMVRKAGRTVAHTRGHIAHPPAANREGYSRKGFKSSLLCPSADRSGPVPTVPLPALLC